MKGPSWVRTAAACAAAMLAASCGPGGSAEAQKKAAKRERDAALLSLSYPEPTGVTPGSMEVAYDGARDRTTMTLRLTGVRVTGRGAGQVTGATLYLVSSHKGRARAPDDPEGSIDGSVVVTATTPGVLAFSGPPGELGADGRATTLRGPSGGETYTSRRSGSATEEVVRFRIPTEALVSAAVAGEVGVSVGTIRVELGAAERDALREFAARLNPAR